MNYERINKKVLQNTKSGDIMNDVIGNTVKKEQDLPEALKGNAMGLPQNLLLGGSIYASGIWKKSNSNGIYNEFVDHIAIKEGFEYYEKQNK